MIYALALHEPRGLQVEAKPGVKLTVNPQHSQSSPVNGLLRTCKQIRGECKQMFYAANDQIIVLLPFIEALDPGEHREKYTTLVTYLRRLPIPILHATRFVFILRKDLTHERRRRSKGNNRTKLLSIAGTLANLRYNGLAAPEVEISIVWGNETFPAEEFKSKIRFTSLWEALDSIHLSRWVSSEDGYCVTQMLEMLETHVYRREQDEGYLTDGD